jgi:UDP-2,3-diacylglucosamine hydrolase
LGKLAEIRDSGIPIYFFVGNHDLWMEDYFKKLNIPVYHDNQNFFGTKHFLLVMVMAKGLVIKDIKNEKVFTIRFKWLLNGYIPILAFA